MQPKNYCLTCKYENLEPNQEPCNDCRNGYELWESKTTIPRINGVSFETVDNEVMVITTDDPVAKEFLRHQIEIERWKTCTNCKHRKGLGMCSFIAGCRMNSKWEWNGETDSTEDVHKRCRKEIVRLKEQIEELEAEKKQRDSVIDNLKHQLRDIEKHLKEME